jgi:ATP-dependent DNA ligase
MPPMTKLFFNSPRYHRYFFREGRYSKRLLFHRTDEVPVEKVPVGDWLYEIKHDGYRALAFKDGKDVRLISRNNKQFTYQELLNALTVLPAKHMVLDGEIAALDEKGALRSGCSSSSKSLEAYHWSTTSSICFLEGKDLRKEPLTTRRKLLANLLEKAPENVRLSGELHGSKDDLLRLAQEFDLEGLVAKRPIFSLRKRPAKWRLGQIQDHQSPRVRNRRLHGVSGKPEPFRILTCSDLRT